MILNALARHYDVLVAQEELEKPGWSHVKVSWGLELNEDGELVQLIPLELEAQRGKKKAFVPQEMNLPTQVKRSSGVAPNFLCDNSSYMLGIDDKGKPDRSRKCFEACRALHQRILGAVDHPLARAIFAFFERWKPEDAAENAELKADMEGILKGGNLVFLMGNDYAHEVPEIQQAWDRCYQEDEDAPMGRCLVTGEVAPIAILHPNIKGVAGAQSSGASLVSFNAPAFESYGRESAQGLNAPVSKRVAFAYGEALNYLISHRGPDGWPTNMIRISDMSIVFWAEDGQAAYADSFSCIFQDDGTAVRDDDVRDVMKRLTDGQTVCWKGSELKPDNHFYILGISPNAARLSIRFFVQDTFQNLMRNIARHQDRLEMVRPAYEKRKSLSVWGLLNETVNQSAREKSPSQQLSGELVRAVLNDLPYPASLLEQVEMRIRAEQRVTWGRASIIKAVLLKNVIKDTEGHPLEEVAKMVLNEDTTYQPYVLGRLFSVLEGLQQAANPNINATIRDRYFNSACATPAVAFPTLIRLAQAHLKKLTVGNRIYFDKQITELESRMQNEYPRRLNLYDQGIFQIGYYHQTQKRFTKEEETHE